MNHYFISVGSSSIHATHILMQTFASFRKHTKIIDCINSSLYRNPYQGTAGLICQYTNSVCYLQTTIALSCLWFEMHRIEKKFGRMRLYSHNPRLLDLDLIAMYPLAWSYWDTNIHCPHPRASTRLFVLKPFEELLLKLPKIRMLLDWHLQTRLLKINGSGLKCLAQPK